MIWLLYILAAIGLMTVTIFLFVVGVLIVQVTTDDNLQPHKPWWWRF